MTQAAVKVLNEIWHNKPSISLGDKNIHNAYPGLFLTHLEAGHLELFPYLKPYENPKADLLKTKGIFEVF